MRVIIAGGRDIHNYSAVLQAISDSGFRPTVIVSGCAAGVDRLGEKYAHNNSLPIDRHPADWNKHGRAAGPIRNESMARAADCLVAVWDGKSKGTRNIIETARKHKLQVHVHLV